MTTYSVRLSDGMIIRAASDEDGPEATIPPIEGNSDYASYLTWVAAGNTAQAYKSGVDSDDPVQAWAAYQALVRAALSASDTTVLRCYETNTPVPLEWANYRKALRAIVSMTSGDPTQPLPTRPAYPDND